MFNKVGYVNLVFFITRLKLIFIVHNETKIL